MRLNKERGAGVKTDASKNAASDMDEEKRLRDRRLFDTHAEERIEAERLLRARLLYEKRMRNEWAKLREFEMNYVPPDME